MKLHAHHIAAFDGGREGFNVVSSGGGIRSYGGPVRVGEVDIGVLRHTGEQTRLGTDGECVPADVRDFFNPFRETGTGIGKVGQAGLVGSLGRSGVKPLHTYADAQKRSAALDGCADSFSEAGLVETLCRGEVPDAGE